MHINRRSLLCGAGAAALPLLGAGAAIGASARLSTAVALAYNAAEARSFLATPSIGYVQTYFSFPAGLRDDVGICLDQEMMDGVVNPTHGVVGGDWMGFVMLMRGGLLWVAQGTAATHAGTPSAERSWHVIQLPIARMAANSWWKMRVTSDFAKREFVAFTLTGPGVSQTVDLRGLKLDYPNYMPFDGPTMGYYVGALRNAAWMTTVGTPKVYFDFVEGGIVTPLGDLPLFADGFETIGTVRPMPALSIPIRRAAYGDGIWTKERPEAIVNVVCVNGTPGNRCVLQADVTL